jgi:hypothetical protein
MWAGAQVSFSATHPTCVQLSRNRPAPTPTRTWCITATHRPTAHRRPPLPSPASRTADASVHCRRGGAPKGRPNPPHCHRPDALPDRRAGSQMLLRSSFACPPSPDLLGRPPALVTRPLLRPLPSTLARPHQREAHTMNPPPALRFWLLADTLILFSLP